MTKDYILQELTRFVLEAPGNRIPEAEAIDPACAGLQIYEAPILGFASGEDPLFYEEFKKPGVIHPEHLAPKEWLPAAKTVISFFLPFTETVKRSNRCKSDEPYAPGIPQRCSAQWLHARVEGQAFLDQLTDHLQALLEQAGYEALCPATSGSFRMIEPYISNWSERHAAYAAGLGTFGLSKGLITQKGMAGRFGSVITGAEFTPTPRPYSDPFEYCTLCGACMVNCPPGAIDSARGCALGKDQNICGPYMQGSRLPPHGPNQVIRYGCGKCQVGVPCESRIPRKPR